MGPPRQIVTAIRSRHKCVWHPLYIHHIIHYIIHYGSPSSCTTHTPTSPAATHCCSGAGCQQPLQPPPLPPTAPRQHSHSSRCAIGSGAAAHGIAATQNQSMDAPPGAGRVCVRVCAFFVSGALNGCVAVCRCGRHAVAQTEREQLQRKQVQSRAAHGAHVLSNTVVVVVASAECNTLLLFTAPVHILYLLYTMSYILYYRIFHFVVFKTDLLLQYCNII